MLDVSVHLLLEDWSGSDAEICRALLAVVGVENELGDEVDPQAVLDRLAYDRTSPVWSSLEAARENARTVREVLPSEMWVCLNTTYNAFPRTAVACSRRRPLPVLHLRQGPCGADVWPGRRHDESRRRMAIRRAGQKSRTRRHDGPRVLAVSSWSATAQPPQVHCCEAARRTSPSSAPIGACSTQRGRRRSSCWTGFFRARCTPRSSTCRAAGSPPCCRRADSRLGVADPGLVALGRMRTNLGVHRSASEVLRRPSAARSTAIQRRAALRQRRHCRAVLPGASTIEWVAGGVS